MKKETGITIGICCVFLLTAGFFYLHTEAGRAVSGQNNGQWAASVEGASDASSVPETADTGADASETECTIYICGAVKHPGVYRFSGDSRVCDAIEAAGGFTKKASRDSVNQARPLADGEQITIPKKQKGKKHLLEEGLAEHNTSKDNLVDLNEAGREELMTLSGIGEAKAQMIIDYRRENGCFSCTADIMKISGIKEGIYNKIKDRITV